MLNNSELLDEYLNKKQMERKVSEETLSIYKSEINDFIEYLYPENLLTVSKFKIAQYIEYLEGSYAKRSIRRRLISIRGLYRYFIKEQRIMRDPFEEIKYDILDSRAEKLVEESEIKNILDQIPSNSKGVRDKLLIALLFTTGIKINDLLSIRVQDIFENREINILKKDGRIVIRLEEEVSNLLKEYTEKERDLIEESGEELLFKSLSRQNFRARFIKYEKMAGTEKNILPSDIKKISKKIALKSKEIEEQDEKEILKKIKAEYIRIGIGDD